METISEQNNIFIYYMFNNFSPEKIIIFAIIFICLFEASAQVCLKKFDSNNKNTYFYFIIGAILYFFVVNLLCYCYTQKGRVSNVNIMWSSMSIIIVIIFAFIFLKENVNKYQIIAIVFALLAIYFANKK